MEAEQVGSSMWLALTLTMVSGLATGIGACWFGMTAHLAGLGSLYERRPR